jgi:arylsulfatase A-like enzyme
MVWRMDVNVGKLMRALEETGQADNTIVMFTSDNGGLATSEGSPTSNLPLIEGKGWMYEGGTREPLIVRWPGAVAAGSACDVPVTSTDFYPTILEAAGLPAMPAQHCDGVSLVPLLKRSGRPAREALFWHYPHYGNQGGTPGGSVRSGDWKLIEFFEDDRVELYNLREDPGEQHDRSGDTPDRTKELRERLHEWQSSVGAIRPQPNPEWRSA